MIFFLTNLLGISPFQRLKNIRYFNDTCLLLRAGKLVMVHPRHFEVPKLRQSH